MPTNLAAQPAKQLNRRLYHWRQNWPLSGSARMSVRKAQATVYTEDMRKASSHQSARDRETERAPADRTPRAGSSASNRPSRRGMSGGRASQSPELLRRLLRARDRMDVASHEDWPVRRLARVSGVSAAHFARSFKRAFGVPPHRYLLARRIERAAALLRDTDLPITEIAFNAGWASLGTFGRTLRDVTGQTPGAIRSRGRATARGLGVSFQKVVPSRW